jgi:hypothetical protein
MTGLKRAPRTWTGYVQNLIAEDGDALQINLRQVSLPESSSRMPCEAAVKPNMTINLMKQILLRTFPLLPCRG